MAKDDRRSDSSVRPQDSQSDLRLRAEDRLRAMATPNPEALSADQVGQLMHELHVHQIELEMQNEELRRAQQHLEASRTRYFDLYDLAPVGYLTFSERGSITEANLTATTLLGTSRSALVGQPLTQWIVPAYQDVYYHCRKRLLTTGEPQVCELQLTRQDGALLWVRLESIMAEDRATGVPVCRGTLSDISRQKLAETDLKLAASVFEHSVEGIAITDADARIVEVNVALTQITGYRREEVLGRTPSIFKSRRQGPEFYEAMWHTLTTVGYWRGELWNRHKDGTLYPVLLAISAVRVEGIAFTHYVGFFTDISSLKRHQEQLERIAHFDVLTGIPNRFLLVDRMRQAIALAKTRTHRLIAVCYLDLDGFKQINDSYGHETGDRLLMEMGVRFREQLRDGDTVARLGGDEFILLITDLERLEECEAVLQRTLAAVKRPVQIGEKPISVSASIGVSIYPMDDAAPDTLMRHADQAMYQAKQEGRNRYCFYDPDRDRSARERLETRQRIQQALEQREFVLHYQPKVDMRQGKVVGVEALLRWRHPERGLLPPSEFLPIIEGSDLIVALGDWVIGEVLRQLVDWSEEGLEVCASVNVAARHLQTANFVQRLQAQQAIYPGLPTGSLEIEVLETDAMADLSYASGVIEHCRKLGVNCALDDFGTGYSSLAYLRRLPANTIKIDASFVHDMLRDRENLAIVEGVIGLAHAFQRVVVAEGVENTEVGIMLVRMGCDLAQGYGIARPMPPDALPGWIAAWKPDPAWCTAGSDCWSRGDLPLILARYDHRLWIDSIADLVEGRSRKQPLIVSLHRCRFGRWYNNAGTCYGERPGFATLGALHERVHQLGSYILALMDEPEDPNRVDQARVRLQELFAVRDEMLKILDGFLASDHHHDGI